MRQWILAGVLFCAIAHAQSRPVDTFAEVDAIVLRGMTEAKLPGAGLILIRGDKVLHEKYFGEYDVETVVSIASASKWLSAATIMALVDERKLDLDKPIVEYLSEWKPQSGDKFDRSMITIRQLFSHTSGLPSDAAAVEQPLISMREAARRAAELPLEAKPGTRFRYGGVSMQVAAAIAEEVSGKPWRELFAEKIARPCEMHSTRFGRMERAPNPQVAGGASSTLRNYANFCEMLLADGEFRGRRVLSRESVREMLSVQTKTLPVRRARERNDTPKSRYGLGNWVDAFDANGNGVVNSSPGKFGFHPWIDRQRGIITILMIEDRSDRRDRRGGERSRRELLDAINRCLTID